MNSWSFPAVSYNFSVNVGLFMGSDSLFSDVDGISMSLETSPLKEGGNNSYTHNLPGQTEFKPLVLKRGLISMSSFLFVWCQATIIGNYTLKIKPMPVMVQLLNEKGMPLVMWFFNNAYPKKFEVSSLNAKASGDGAIMVETIELAYSEFTRVDIMPSWL